jgi:hypothetical protein
VIEYIPKTFDVLKEEDVKIDKEITEAFFSGETKDAKVMVVDIPENSQLLENQVVDVKTIYY